MTVYISTFGRFVLYLSTSGDPVRSHLEFRTLLQIISRNFINWCQKGTDLNQQYLSTAILPVKSERNHEY